jgi:cell division protein FtsN
MINNHYKQQGGTLLGIIIGLIVGLAVAVVVALAITKTSLPFVNKPGKAERSADASSSQSTDPNKPIYGNRESVKEAAKDFAKSAEGNPPAVVRSAAKQAEEKPEAAGDNKQDEKPVADKPKKNDKLDAKMAEPKGAEHKELAKDAVAKADNPDEKWIYYLQAGAFREAGDAENAKAKLALLGFEARVAERPSENGALYRVRLGPFSQIETMNRVRAKLSENGVDVAVVRNPK